MMHMHKLLKENNCKKIFHYPMMCPSQGSLYREEYLSVKKAFQFLSSSCGLSSFLCLIIFFTNLHHFFYTAICSVLTFNVLCKFPGVFHTLTIPIVWGRRAETEARTGAGEQGFAVV